LFVISRLPPLSYRDGYPAVAILPVTETYVPELQSVDTLLQNFMVGKPIPGGTIAITHNDKVIYERGIGFSNAENTVPMQETELMRLASVSKPVTASAIQQLAKDGQLLFNISSEHDMGDPADLFQLSPKLVSVEQVGADAFHTRG
jgi:CubicO group peptidase (beta-lactamase class C family)